MRWRGALFGLLLAPQVMSADPAANMMRDLLSGPARSDQFAPALLDSVPLETVTRILDPLRAEIGTVTDLRLNGDTVTVTTRTHKFDGRIALDAQGRVALLYVTPPIRLGQSLTDALAGFDALAANVSYLVTRGGQVLAARDADVALPVASAFKLGVLAVLKQDVQDGLRTWADVAHLDARHLSLPTGILQDFVPGSPVTLHTLAALMISQSDNTATDALIDTLGRDRIAKALGDPLLLSTREYFALAANPDAQQAFLRATPEDALRIAQDAASTLPDVTKLQAQSDGFSGWRVTAKRLCHLLDQTADLDVFAINPGPVRAQPGPAVAYKGGSLPGVLNFSTRISGPDPVCVVVTLNSAADIPLDSAVAAYRAVIAAVMRD